MSSSLKLKRNWKLMNVYISYSNEILNIEMEKAD